MAKMNRDDKETLAVMGGCLLPALLLVAASAAAWVTHVVVCIKASAWVLLAFGCIVAPVGVIHGVGAWFGAWA